MYRPFVTRTWAGPVLCGLLFVAGAGICGCASEHGRSANLDKAETLTAGDGRGGLLKATMPSGGEVFVLDASDNRLLWSGQAHTGDEIVVDARSNIVSQNGKTVAEPEKMPGGDRYLIRFYRPN